MGTHISKIGQILEEDEPIQASLPSTPILTPKIRPLDYDPRSPSANIVRTPIQLSNVLNKNHTPIIGEINTSYEITTDDDNSCENPSAIFDPRSPSMDFTRTPIVIEKSTVKLRNKNLDNVKKLMTFTPVNKNINCAKQEKNDNILEKTNRGPILLESSPIVRKIEQNEKRKSNIGLLETNLDYVETDLDLYIIKENNIKIENEPLSLLIENKSLKEGNIPEEQFQPDDNKHKDQINVSPEHKLYVLNQIDEEIKEVIEVTVDPTTDLDKSKMEVIDENQTTPKLKTTEKENPVSDFDMKITNLIYEDQDVQVLTPKQTKPKDSNRTPLGDRNRVNSSRPKSAVTRLKIHDKPKNEYTVSKIPVFKDKCHNNKNGQCENTPPNYKKVESRIKKSQWDSDKTLII